MSLDDHTGAWAPRENRAAPRERRLFRLILLTTLPLILLLVLVLPGVGPIFRTFTSVSTSMAPTLPLQTTNIASRLSYGYTRQSFDWFELPISGRWPESKPARGDIVVFRTPKDRKAFYIKRLIGLPGDRVQMVKGRLVINGTTVERELAKKKARDPFDKTKEVDTYTEKLPGGVSYSIIETQGDKGGLDETQEFKVPDGHYFFMGDNRDNSADSRVEQTLGTVPFELLMGRVVMSLPPGHSLEDDDE